MKRRIIIITNPGVIGAANYCEGVYKDKENYISFFKSGFGGFYSDAEIRAFDKPTKAKVRNELSLLTRDQIEFSILIFCGHGWYSTISNSSIFEINNTENIDSLEFRVGARKRIIIEDNCREKYDEYISESEMKKFSAYSLHGDILQNIDPEQCKKYYNSKISSCSEQIIIAMACNIGETAGDSSISGGYYSNSLIKQAMDITTSNLQIIDLKKNYKIFNFPDIHNFAVPLVRKRSGDKQNPQIEKPRYSDSENYLPFAIIA